MRRDTDTQEKISTGGQPDTAGLCTNCGAVYPVTDDSGRLRPIGTEGSCRCGNDEFEAVTDREWS